MRLFLAVLLTALTACGSRQPADLLLYNATVFTVDSAFSTAEAIAIHDGKVLATWKSAKPSIKFNAELFKTSMPDIYKQFEVEVPGSRRFLIK